MFQVWLVDADGFFIKDESVKEVTPSMIITPILIGYVKPKWDGEKWVEGATEEEIREWEEQDKIDICEPTDRERMEQIEGMVGMLAEQLAKQSLGM